MKTIKKNKLKDEVRISIQTAIINRELKPGDRIVETRLAADMGVSQAPVREALKELEHVGLIENRPYQGTYVKQLTTKELRDAYDARIILELYSVETAAAQITDEQLHVLRELLDKMNAAAAKGNIEAFVDADVEFHETILQSSGNDLVLKLWHQTHISLFTHVTTNLSKRSLVNLASRHMDVYRTLENHDVQGARDAMLEHLKELRDEMMESVENVGHVENAEQAE